MKNKLIKRFLIPVAGVVALVLSATSTFAITNSTSVVSPFWQSDGSIYTFVAVSHSSLQTMNSEVGVVVSALSVTGGSFGSAEFTVSQNSTTRVFIVSTNHSTINSLVQTGTKNVFIAGTTNLTSGQLRITPKATAPLFNAETNTAGATQVRDITMLSFWGSVVIPGTNTGFAMEFIGDTHDSLFALTTVSTGAIQLPVGVN